MLFKNTIEIVMTRHRLFSNIIRVRYFTLDSIQQPIEMIPADPLRWCDFHLERSMSQSLPPSIPGPRR
jgi:hypothetical protein